MKIEVKTSRAGRTSVTVRTGGTFETHSEAYFDTPEVIVLDVLKGTKFILPKGNRQFRVTGPDRLGNQWLEVV